MHAGSEHKPDADTAEPPAAFGKSPALARSPEQQSWGTAIAIIIIVVMVVVGAVYAWNKRAAERYTPAPVVSASSTAQG